MDLPILLDKDSSFINGLDELRQNLFLLLKEPIMTWYQSCSVGSRIILHSSSSEESELKIQVQDTLKQINNIDVDNISVDGNRVEVLISYNGQKIIEEFDLEK